MSIKKLGSTKLTDDVLVSSVNLASEVTGILGVANGGTGQSVFTNGQLLIGNTTGNTLTKATLTAGSGISITNGAGSISIANTAQTQWTTNGSDIYYNTGNVGIGASAPTYRLQLGVNGSLADSIRIGTYQVSNNTRQYIGYARADTGLFESSGNGDTPSTVLAGVAGIRIVNTTGVITPAQADNSVQLLTHIYNGNSRVALHANYDGKVGIGTTSPSYALHVVGDIYAANGGDIRIQPLSGADVVLYSDGGELQFYVNNSTRAYINTSGNFGIGTTNPSARLSVSGGTELNSTAQTIGMSGTGGANNNIYNWAITSENDTNWGFRVSNKANGQYYTDVLGAWSDGNNRGFRVVNKQGASETVALYVNSSNNVGIGTTSPEARLDVDVGAPTNAVGIYLDTDGSGGAAGIGVGSSVGPYLVGNTKPDGTVRGAYGASRMAFNAGGFSFDYSSTTSGARVWTSYAVLNSSGNVGIGTTSPSYRLDVSGSVRSGGGNTSALLVQATGTATTQAAIALQQLTTEGDTIIFADYEPYAEYGIIARNSIDSIDFTAGSSSNSLANYSITNRSGSARTAYVKARINLGGGEAYFGGNVGIGTLTPAVKLQINNGGLRAIGSGAQVDVDSSGGAFRFYDGATFYGGLGMGNWAGFPTATDIVMYLNGVNYHISSGTTTRLYVQNSTGNVGIGTTSPSARLHVSAADTNDIIRLQRTGSAAGTGIIYANSNEMFGVQDGTRYPFQIKQSAPSDSLVIASSGNVGIGTTSPADKLHVIGNLSLGSSSNAQIIYRTASNWRYHLGAVGDNFFVYDAQSVNYFAAYYNGGGTGKYASILGAVNVFNSGNVGIGTTSPYATLAVSGNVGVNGTTNSGGGAYMYDSYVNASSSYYQIPQSRVRLDSSATGGIDQAPVSLFLHNENGTNNTWVKLSMGGREEPSAGNTVSWAGIAARKVGGASGNWASGELHLWTKSGATQIDAVTIASGGAVSAASTITASDFILSSDRRRKTELVRISDALAKVLEWAGYTYRPINDERRRAGLMAQDVEVNAPEVVYTDDDGYKSMSYEQTIPYLVEAIRDLHRMVEALA